MTTNETLHPELENVIRDMYEAAVASHEAERDEYHRLGQQVTTNFNSGIIDAQAVWALANATSRLEGERRSLVQAVEAMKHYGLKES